ncbi:hypothetical protein D8B26_003241 [Coccidioides posadasii str. Silveira]|uniref:uncharacterized protein n=1 Tax=Coccidioides posadasii (strain RMSCC 757 / Silveira) TaxID=443226 RepID=UPI001BED7AD9|nr:hypothetical protein D8B26_003241 [Coccidioides posadasii str. Silveira]
MSFTTSSCRPPAPEPGHGYCVLEDRTGQFTDVWGPFTLALQHSEWRGRAQTFKTTSVYPCFLLARTDPLPGRRGYTAQEVDEIMKTITDMDDDDDVIIHEILGAAAAAAH